MSINYNPHYYSIDDIFVTQERIPCRSLQVHRKMGFIDAGNDSEDLKEQQNVNLPLWYCLAIDSSRNPTFKIQIPEIYRSVYTDICKADSKVVQLGKLNKYFYELGRYCSKFDRTGEVAKMIFDTCKTRMKYLKDVCCNDQMADVKASYGLEFLEHELYKAGARQTQRFSQWLHDDTNCNIKASEMVQTRRKRSRLEMENN